MVMSIGQYVRSNERIELISAASRACMGASDWLDRLLAGISFRRRLLGLALRRLDDIPAAVVMALEEPDHDTFWLSEGAPLMTEPGEGTSAQGMPRSQGAAQVGTDGREHVR